MLVLLATVLLFSGAILLMLQTDPVKTYLAERAETWFNTNFEGTLHIGEIGGLLPMHVEIRDLLLEYEDHTIISMESMRVSVDLISLLRNHLTINDLALVKPSVYLRTGDDGVYTLSRALTRIPDKDEFFPYTGTEQQFLPGPIRALDIYAPFMQIHDGLLHVIHLPDGVDNRHLPESFLIARINTEMFLEISSEQRYLDITYLTLFLEDLESRELLLSGQIYNDSRYLEFNLMRMRLGDSYLDWNMEFDGINLFDGNLSRQFTEASWTLLLKDAFFSQQELALLTTDLPESFEGLKTSLAGSGSGYTVSLADAELFTGNTGLRFDAEINDFNDRNNLTYLLNVRDILVDQTDLDNLFAGFSGIPFHDWDLLRTGGILKGNADTLDIDMDFGLPEGNLKANGHLELASPMALDLMLSGNQINPAALQGWSGYPGLINVEILIDGKQLTGSSPEFHFNIDLFDSEIGDMHIPDLHLDIGYSDKIITHEFNYYQTHGYINGEGSLNLQGDWPHLQIKGISSGLDLSAMTTQRDLPVSQWNMNYDINWHGRHLEQWHGRVVVDVSPSLLNGTELSSHQLYLDLNHPESPLRSLRLTSSVADFVMEGEFSIPSIPRLFHQWHDFLVHRFNEEILFSKKESSPPRRANPDDLLHADLYFEVKNPNLLRAYIPKIPEIKSTTRLQMELYADFEKIETHSEWHDDKITWGDFSLEETDLALSAGFRFDQHLHDFLDLNMDLQVLQISYQDQHLDSLSWSAAIAEGIISSRSRIANFGNQVRFASEIAGRFSDSDIHFTIENLILGNYRFMWMTEGRPFIRYEDEGRLHIGDFYLMSDEDRIFVDGTFSSDPDDSVEYRFVNVNLDRISQMIEGKVGFQGVLNGDFVTKNLAINPVFHGQLAVDRLAFNDRIIGDVSLTSTYNPEKDRFDSDLLVITDATKYAAYIENNNNTRQHVTATGWFRAPDINEPVDSLYYFDVDVRELDAWVLRYLMDAVFESIEGKATGTGYLTGNFSHIDFHGDFEILESQVVPVFLEPLYRLNGKVSVNRQDGVIIHELNVRDAGNGRGVVTGNYDFNDFKPEKFMDITLRMQNLRFLDNSAGPEVPFYGRIAGTGVVNISGSNVSPLVRTIEPISTTSQSRLSIPLIGQAMDEAQGRFIRFVKDFEEIDFRRHMDADPAVLRRIDRTFMEVFRLDLQFVAAPNSTVQLIFDPVTGEIVNAQGSGRVRITLQDEDLQIFGNFDISSGDYLFIGGDILTRRFILREGGTIRLEGDPTNALLDITAVYRSRPNIAPLLGAAPDMVNRVPVELLLQITGPIDNIENDFYFEFPNAIDATQNVAVLNVLNSEEQKLIQATSLLFTGGFISGTLVGDTQTQELGTTLQTRAGQVGISQLLSAQINTLLSDNLINLDVDLNLLGFDQADLGIALRLFDDRLVLRREGEVGGEETNIGDLGATYRINPNLSVEVFHRKDPMLMSILGTQADVENVNGIGLEAQFRFNSWRDMGNRLWKNVTTLFGLIGNSTESQADRETETETADDIADSQKETTDRTTFLGIREESADSEILLPAE